MSKHHIDIAVDQAIPTEHLRSNATKLSLALNETARSVPRFADRLSSKEKARAFAEEEHASLISYLARWIESGDPVFRALYLGERAKMAYNPAHSITERNDAIASMIQSDAHLLDTALTDATCRQVVADRFAEMASRVATSGAKGLRVLLIGDCLHLDITGFLIDDTARSGIAIRPTYLTNKNPAGLVDAIRKLAGETFDAVFYSPFTYENGLTVPQILTPSKAMAILPGSRTQSAVAGMMAEVEQVSEVLARTFAAPIFVHNTALVRRHTGRIRDAVIRRFSATARRAIRTEVDRRIDALLARLNSETFPHLHKLDELAFLDDWSEEDLGSYLHHHGLQHPARLGAVLASRYAIILETVGHLAGKKLIVCDLDNTLWDGVIGEGSVTHHIDRQETLRRLKDKGVVLAIASKNDPKNVVWHDGILNAADFVSSQISWGPKVAAFPAIERELNLKRKDFVFVDDRADERELVAETYPEVHVVDAEAPRTWEMFALWVQLLGDGSDMDRTQMYLDRAKRLKFEAKASEENESGKAELFAKLGLDLTISEAGPKNLKRATELINRTNQFNMTAARTTFDEVHGWAESPSHRVWIAVMRDKFGDMGIVSVLVVDLSGEMAKILAFVLSCRVFGYDVEHALLNQVKCEVAVQELAGIVGRHVPTMVNAPCRDTYRESGFLEADGAWFWKIGDEERADPEWLSINRT
jgi:FkbH-like protein